MNLYLLLHTISGFQKKIIIQYKSRSIFKCFFNTSGFYLLLFFWLTKILKFRKYIVV